MRELCRREWSTSRSGRTRERSTVSKAARAALFTLLFALGCDGGKEQSGAVSDAGSGGDGPAIHCLPQGVPFTWPTMKPADVPTDASWKSALELPTDGFFTFTQDELVDAIAWVKFVIVTSDPERIYFQDPTAAPFHFDFASRQI